MAVPMIYGQGNAFQNAFSGANNMFADLIKNRYMPEQMKLANQGQNLQNQTQQFNLANLLPQQLKMQQQTYNQNEQLNPIEVAMKNLNLTTNQQLSPLQVQQAQQNLQGTQNTNALFPQQQTAADLANQKTQQEIQNLVTRNNAMQKGMLPGANVKPGQMIIDPNTGQVSYAPTTQAITKSQEMNMARSEASSLHGVITKGLEPYQGVMGQGKLKWDLYQYRAGLASPAQIERLQQYQAAVAATPTYYAAVGRAATGGVPGESELQGYRKTYGFPEEGINLGGADATKAQEILSNALATAGQQSINSATAPLANQIGNVAPAVPPNQAVLKFNPKTGKFD